MTNEKEAHLAREQHGEYLRRLGAHGIAVEAVKRRGKKTFAVVSFFARKPAALPAVLKVKSGKKNCQVPLVARVMERFKPE